MNNIPVNITGTHFIFTHPLVAMLISIIQEFEQLEENSYAYSSVGIEITG
jgi:hypothetical protein